jgi:hypothetical protein
VSGNPLGRFELSGIANMDQTPIAFELFSSKAYASIGSKTVWVRGGKNGWDRRQASLHIVVFADGIPRCKPLLIFHGKGNRRCNPIHSILKKSIRTTILGLLLCLMRRHGHQKTLQ